MTRATITTPESTVTSLIHQLSEAGFNAKPIDLSGRFHSTVHEGSVESLKSLCMSNAGLQFPTRSHPLVPLRVNSNAQIVTGARLHEIAVRSILAEQSNWYLTIKSSISQLPQDQSHEVLVLGLIDSIPSSILKESNLEVSNLRSLKAFTPQNVRITGMTARSANLKRRNSGSTIYSYPDHAIGIVGMGCRFPGSNSVEDFWEVIKTGTSMLGELPKQRFPSQGLRRSPDNNFRFRGNFLDDADAFDHRFFKKSSREAASMDPQHRLALQVAYEALESSGYFNQKSRPKDIGCYMGVAASDYEDNVASHLPTAFSVPGMVRAFVSGKISHFFGFDGPSLVFDTACSSSAVAIHTACKAISTGECSMALAGGVNVITSPTLHQNLAAANFLSPTGASKAFDAKADGYCRGEGAGVVVLKKLSSALSDNDNILGVLVGSAVNQNDNCAPITVPNSVSQSTLYRRVLSLAGMEPGNVSFVEAHGTGTSKGDPIECESIRQVFGGQSRQLHFGSVKGNIGHTEAASGAAGLIKVLLMMQHKTIPKQASFATLNPAIAPLEPSNMVIPTTSQEWNPEFMAACVNNYGAAGSNAAMLVCQPPLKTATQASFLSKYPIFLSAQSTASLQENCMALRRFIAKHSSPTQEKLLASIAFNLAHKQNKSLSHVKAVTARSLTDLDHQLSVGTSDSVSLPTTKVKPVVLVLSGQTGNTVSFCEEAFRDSLLLQIHLKECDKILRSMNLKGLFPDIFKSEPVEDVIDLHCMLFSLQYSCAKCWLASGLEVEAVIGHSFGQLTALCVAGSLSLEHGLRLISGRASLIKNKWGQEKGSMISLDTDIDTIKRLVSLVEQAGVGYKVEIACYNGPTSFVLAGSKASIDTVEAIVARETSSRGPIKTKRLNVSHGFHSEHVDAILADFSKIVEGLTFTEPKIPIETCSKGESWTTIGPGQVVGQSREPVYFRDAVERIEQRLGLCTWIEAGSGSPVISMIRHALGSPKSTAHSFHPVKLNSPDPMSSLADTTINLWKAGINAQFWPFHSSQGECYLALNLPPYQFEKSRHWLDYIDRHEVAKAVTPVLVNSKPTLVSFIKHSDPGQQLAEFSVNQTSEQYKALVQGHAVLGSTLCPASLYVEIAARAVTILKPEFKSSSYVPYLEELEMYAPLGIDLDRDVHVSLRAIDGSLSTWRFALSSYDRKDSSRKTQHATARINFLPPGSTKTATDFARYERLINFDRCKALFIDDSAETMQGSLVYKMFAKVVNYAGIYRGVRKISSKNCEITGQVIMPSSDSGDLTETICAPLAVDNFTQVAGLHVNSLEDCGDNEVFVCTKIDQLHFGQNFRPSGSPSGPFIVYSNFDRKGDRELTNDIFVYDSTCKRLVMTILGVQFTKVVITSLRKALSRANPAQALVSSAGDKSSSLDLRTNSQHGTEPSAEDYSLEVDAREKANGHRSVDTKDLDSPNTRLSVQKLLHEVADIPMEEILDASTLEELGIDSLMATELLNEIAEKLDVSIPVADFENISSFRSLWQYIGSRQNRTLSVPSPRDTDSGIYSSNTSTPATQDSSSPYPESNEAHKVLVSKLSKLVADHLDTADEISPDTDVRKAGLDSLLGIELGVDIEKTFGVKVDMMHLDQGATFGDLCNIVLPRQDSQKPTFGPKDGEIRSSPGVAAVMSSDNAVSGLTIKRDPTLRPSTSASEAKVLTHAARDFAKIRHDYERFAKSTGFANFRITVYPKQAQLVLAYVVEAFAALGCSLKSLQAGDQLLPIPHIPKHTKVVSQYYKILEEASLVSVKDNVMVRTEVPVGNFAARQLYEEIITSFPQHASEHKLLNSTGSKLADCLSGKVDPLQIMFRSKADRELLEDVYTNSPMFATGTRILGNFFTETFSKYHGPEKLRILELGAGTGGTTKYIVDLLLSKGINFTYTFTDLSSSMVMAAKRKFANYDCMEYMVLDVEESPPTQLLHSYHTVLSSNCVHATKSLLRSSMNIHKLLRSDGFLCLLELTRNLFWLDCVFGLLEGWWMFEDGRKHVLADELLWKRTLLEAGFKHIDWSDDATEESDQFRVIAAFMSESQVDTPANHHIDRGLSSMETLEFHRVGETSLYADIYYPSRAEASQVKRPIGKAISLSD